MTASAVYNFLHTPVHYTTYEIEDLLYTGRLLEPMGRMFRRIGAALCAVMIAETAGSISTASAQNPLPLTRAGVHISSIIASVFALAECIIAVLFVNANASSKYSSPRVDDQFNGSKTAMILGGVAVIVLIIGSISVMTAAVKAAKVTVGGELTVVSLLDVRRFVGRATHIETARQPHDGRCSCLSNCEVLEHF